MALSKKKLAFIDEYFICKMNATDAYLNLYPKSSYNAARAHGARMVADGSIQEEIARRLKARHMSAEEAIARMADMGRGDIVDFAEVQYPADLLKPEYKGKTHVIKKFKRRVITTKQGSVIEETELEMYDAQAALRDVGKVQGVFRDVLEHTGLIQIDDARESLISRINSITARNSEAGSPTGNKP